MLCQQRMVLNAGAFINISHNANVILDNQNTNALQVATTGNIISEGENNVLKWIVNSATGNYVVPFANAALFSIPLRCNITTAGTTSGAGSAIVFSTYETATDANLTYPSDVTHLNSNCRDSVGLFAVDRFWRIDAQGYSTKPTPVISFGYSNSISETGGANTITTGKLKAQRFNNISNSWETPQKLYGTSVLNTVSGVGVTPADFFKSWTLVDSSIMSIAVAISAVNNGTFCPGGTAVITPTGAVSYTLLPNGTVSTTGFTVMPGATTVYTITGSIGSGTATCSSNSLNSATTTILVNPLPVVSSSVTNVVCFGENTGTAIALVSGSATYTWSNGSHASVLTGLYAGTYTLTVQDDNGCASTHTLAITQPANGLNLSISSLSHVLCFGHTNGSAAVTATGGTPAYTYSWLPSGATTQGLSNLSAGNYTAYVMDAKGCKSYSVISIQEPSGPLQAFIMDSTISVCQEANGALWAGGSGGTPQYAYAWYPNGGNTSSLLNIPSGNYALVLTDANGCTDTLQVIMGCESPLMVPQFFTPNADGKNDVFVIKGLEKYPNNQINIYNRWGSLVYSQHNYQNNWDGTPSVSDALGSGILPSATYFVVIDFGNVTNMKPYHGYVELRR